MDACKIAMSPSLHLCNILWEFIKVQNCIPICGAWEYQIFMYMEKGKGYPADGVMSKGWSDTIGISALGPVQAEFYTPENLLLLSIRS